jgi:hypothetical protein
MTIDINTILTLALLGLSTWTLYTVHGLSTQAAARDEKDKAQDARIDENRARIIDVEGDVSDLKIDLARVKRDVR